MKRIHQIIKALENAAVKHYVLEDDITEAELDAVRTDLIMEIFSQIKGISAYD